MERTREFRRNTQLEKLLFQVNDDLDCAERNQRDNFRGKEMQFPLLFVMGPLRSGTTLFMQWLADTGLVAYPTNLLSRFYQAPIIGAKIQLLLTDRRYSFRDELGEFLQRNDYISENGKTTGALSPNEFWYFWRRFLMESSRDVWSDEELSKTLDVETLRAELIGIMDVFQKPFAAKGMLFNYNIPFFNSIIDNALFIQITRDPVANVASILDARKRQMGSENKWYSFKIPEYHMLQEMDAATQSAGQLYYINSAIAEGMKTVGTGRKLLVHYEDFCEDPGRVYAELIEKLNLTVRDTTYHGPGHFNITRNVAQERKVLIKKALSQFPLA